MVNFLNIASRYLFSTTRQVLARLVCVVLPVFITFNVGLMFRLLSLSPSNYFYLNVLETIS